MAGFLWSAHTSTAGSEEYFERNSLHIIEACSQKWYAALFNLCYLSSLKNCAAWILLGCDTPLYNASLPEYTSHCNVVQSKVNSSLSLIYQIAQVNSFWVVFCPLNVCLAGLWEFSHSRYMTPLFFVFYQGDRMSYWFSISLCCFWQKLAASKRWTK